MGVSNLHLGPLLVWQVMCLVVAVVVIVVAVLLVGGGSNKCAGAGAAV